MPTQFREKCRVCGAIVICWGWAADEEFDPDDDRYSCQGSFCDFGDRDGCFGHYCKGCFEKHRCGAYKGEK